MTKYIRTKKEIIDTSNARLNFVTKEEFEKQKELAEEGTIVSYIENNIWYCYCESDGCVWEEKIIKQSDKPEDICDFFMNVCCYCGQYSTTCYLDFEQAKWALGEDSELYGYIYLPLIRGAVRLEPIFKMDEKGELKFI